MSAVKEKLRRIIKVINECACALSLLLKNNQYGNICLTSVKLALKAIICTCAIESYCSLESCRSEIAT